jgi:hypothetical protein
MCCEARRPETNDTTKVAKRQGPKQTAVATANFVPEQQQQTGLIQQHQPQTGLIQQQQKSQLVQQQTGLIQQQQPQTGLIQQQQQQTGLIQQQQNQSQLTSLQQQPAFVPLQQQTSLIQQQQKAQLLQQQQQAQLIQQQQQAQLIQQQRNSQQLQASVQQFVQPLQKQNPNFQQYSHLTTSHMSLRMDSSTKVPNSTATQYLSNPYSSYMNQGASFQTHNSPCHNAVQHAKRLNLATESPSGGIIESSGSENGEYDQDDDEDFSNINNDGEYKENSQMC